MTYTTYFLRFNSQEEAEAKLTEAGYSQTIEVPETKIIFGVPNQMGDIDVIGDIYNNDGVYDTDENGFPIQITPPTKMNGYHLNIILNVELPEVLQEFIVNPLNPYRVFAS
jgi:hypothetical protein